MDQRVRSVLVREARDHERTLSLFPKNSGAWGPSFDFMNQASGQPEHKHKAVIITGGSCGTGAATADLFRQMIKSTRSLEP